MKPSKFLWSLMALPFLVACSQSDAPENSGDLGVREEDGVFMTVNFSPDTQKGSRSFTNGDNSSNSGEEIGTEAENTITNVLLVLATKSSSADNNNVFIAKARINDGQIASYNNNTIYQATAKFSKTNLAEYYSSLSSDNTENPQVNVFLYCNPSLAVVNYFDELANKEEPGNHWVNEVEELGSGTDDVLWNATQSGFLMTNVSMAPRTLPATIADWNLYTESNPFDLSGKNNEGTDYEIDNLGNERNPAGAIAVHRAAARFDFADGSQFDKEVAPNGNGIKGEPFTYSIMTNETDDLVKGTIVSLSLVNMLKKEYYLERVSPTGLNTDVILLGAEKHWFASQPSSTFSGGTYVISPDATEKNNGIDKDFGETFFYPFFDTETGQVSVGEVGWYTSYVSEIMGHASDADGKYKVWRYLTENSLPGVDAQTNGQTTGVVFKVKLTGGDALKNSGDGWDEKLYNALNDQSTDRNPETDPILYYYSGKLYCGWEHVQAAALAAAGFDATKGPDQHLDYAATLYKAVYGNGCPGELKNEGGNTTILNTDHNYPVDDKSVNSKWTSWKSSGVAESEQAFEVFRKAAVNATFALYQTSEDTEEGWGYYCYYYYWNRHNDNGVDGEMAPMEFAVVRNNVYKLAVTRLKTLGHPRIPENDPDTPSPDTPDETGDLYLTVSVTVKPWVVRVNNIEF